MNISLINPYVRLARQSIIPDGHNIVRRVIYDYELIYLEKGSFTLTYNGTEYTCSEGDIIFIRPGIPHCFRIDRGDISQPHIHFDITHRTDSTKIPVSFKDTEAMTEEELGWIHLDYFGTYAKTPFVKSQDTAAFLNVFYKIICSTTDALGQKALITQLISMLIRDNFHNFMSEDSGASVIDQIKSYINAGNGWNMGLDDFSKIFFYSKFYLEKQFREKFGTGLIEYRNTKRMERAKCLLRSGERVSAVAERLGFGSIYSFSRAYKNHFGIAPSKEKP
ncbi:MAG: AraC family transcriptional regulator [Ruminococcaceae bacterium]|nr:AraC family transcriptional regulator [Oscillospiraceae bacterium]